MLQNHTLLRTCTIALYLMALVFLSLFSSFSCFASDTDQKTIAFIRYNLKDDRSSAAIEGFKNTMSHKGYVEGKNITYVDFVTHFPENKSAGDIMHFVDEHMSTTDLFVTSSWTSVYVRSKLAKSQVPQLFAPALQSTVLNMLPSADQEPGTNLSGVYLMYSPEKILQLTKRVLPKVRKYAFVYDSNIPADISFKAEYGQLNENERHGITIYFLDLASGTDTVLQKMNKMGIEAFGGSVGILQNLPELSQINLPIVTALLVDRNRKFLTDLIKDSNILAGLFSPFDECGKQAALMAVDILEGRSSIEKVVPQPAQQLMIVNLVAAKKMNYSLPHSALEAADIVIK